MSRTLAELLGATVDRCARCERVLAIRARGLCASCWNYASKHGELERYARMRVAEVPTERMLQVVDRVARAGGHRFQAAEELGMTTRALDQARYSARRRGLLDHSDHLTEAGAKFIIKRARELAKSRGVK